jgi:hypothetical protein
VFIFDVFAVPNSSETHIYNCLFFERCCSSCVALSSSMQQRAARLQSTIENERPAAYITQ